MAKKKKKDSAKKRNQPGRVVRIGPDVESKLTQIKKADESWSAFLKRIVEGKSYWLVPSANKVFDSKKEAKGFAILRAVNAGQDKPEEPIKVREE